MRVVFDTNVIVSAILSPHGLSAKILDHAHTMQFDLLVSEAIVTEYEESLNDKDVKARHGYTATQITDLIKSFHEFAIVVDPKVKINAVERDPDDNKFVECAFAGKAVYLVTRDPDLLELGSYEDIQIITPVEFLALLKKF